jgi:hypothetical protein
MSTDALTKNDSGGTLICNSRNPQTEKQRN